MLPSLCGLKSLHELCCFLEFGLAIYIYIYYGERDFTYTVDTHTPNTDLSGAVGDEVARGRRMPASGGEGSRPAAAKDQATVGRLSVWGCGCPGGPSPVPAGAPAAVPAEGGAGGGLEAVDGTPGPPWPAAEAPNAPRPAGSDTAPGHQSQERLRTLAGPGRCAGGRSRRRPRRRRGGERAGGVTLAVTSPPAAAGPRPAGSASVASCGRGRTGRPWRIPAGPALVRRQQRLWPGGEPASAADRRRQGGRARAAAAGQFQSGQGLRGRLIPIRLTGSGRSAACRSAADRQTLAGPGEEPASAREEPASASASARR